jgi:hypothetical protein
LTCPDGSDKISYLRRGEKCQFTNISVKIAAKSSMQSDPSVNPKSLLTAKNATARTPSGNYPYAMLTAMVAQSQQPLLRVGAAAVLAGPAPTVAINQNFLS